MLDKEIDRLPEKLRRAFVLCHLEGITNESAAELLGCPHSTIVSRRSRAREQLRDRLTRYGVALSALPAIPVAALPTTAGAATARAAVAFVTSSGPIGIPAQVLLFTNGVLRSMRVT